MIYVHVPYEHFYNRFIQNHDKQEAMLEIYLSLFKSSNINTYDTVFELNTMKHTNGLEITFVVIDVFTKLYLSTAIMYRQIMFVKSNVNEIQFCNMKLDNPTTFNYGNTPPKTMYETILDNELPQSVIDSCSSKRIQFWIYPIPPDSRQNGSFKRLKYANLIGTVKSIDISRTSFGSTKLCINPHAQSIG